MQSCNKRNGIHLEVVAGGNPLEAYRRFAVPAFAEMQEDIRRDVLAWMQRCRITEDGIDMAGEGLVGATSTWTYQINDAADQFSRIPHLVRTMSHAIRGTLFSVRSLFFRTSQTILTCAMPWGTHANRISFFCPFFTDCQSTPKMRYD